ncbi:MAG: hypothetical protein O6951_04890 [Actinobacteria bacterium]|nr:hypothetical protein [Actinomycetota bacterium]
MRMVRSRTIGVFLWNGVAIAQLKRWKLGSWRTGLPAIVLAALLVASCSTAAPTLLFGDDTPDDLREVANGAFEVFVGRFPDRADCIGRVTLTGARHLDDRAFYIPGERSVVLRIPATAPHIETSLVHEWAHHLEFACESHQEFRPPFLRSVGLPPDAGWYDGEVWERVPSEMFASAVVEYVLGRRDEASTIVLGPEAIDLVRDWAGE